MVTNFVVQGFVRGKRGALVAGETRQPLDELRAKRIAERLATTHAGVIAFSRAGDPETGDYEEPVIICQYGQVPEEMLGA